MKRVQTESGSLMETVLNTVPAIQYCVFDRDGELKRVIKLLVTGMTIIV